jgi:hypothetical protein
MALDRVSVPSLLSRTELEPAAAEVAGFAFGAEMGDAELDPHVVTQDLACLENDLHTVDHREPRGGGVASDLLELMPARPTLFLKLPAGLFFRPPPCAAVRHQLGVFRSGRPVQPWPGPACGRDRRSLPSDAVRNSRPQTTPRTFRRWR